MRKNPDVLSSATNPNGLLNEFASGSLEPIIDNPRQRLILAVADIKSYLVEVVGLDPDMAEAVACRDTQEILGALGIKLSQEGMNSLLQEASTLSDEVAVDRAIDMALSNE